nr:hypothetical protein [Tanacetum cinerariifolium]
MANTVFYTLACTALLSSDCFHACLLCLELIIVTIKTAPVSQAENPPLPLELAYSVKSTWRTDLQQTHTAYSKRCMTRSFTKELITPFENPKRLFHLKRRLFETPETMEQYMSKTRGNYESGVVRPNIIDETHFELKGQYLKDLCENTFSGSEQEDANEHIKKVLENEVILFYNGLDVPTKQILDSKGAIPTKTVADANIVIQEMAEYSQNGITKYPQKLEAQDVKILEAYDHTLPQKEKDPRRFTLPCFIHNVCFDKALVDLGASEGLYVKDLDSKTKLIREDDESFDPLYGNYIELKDLDTPLELVTNQDVNFEPSFINKPDNVKTSPEYRYKLKFSSTIRYKNVNVDYLPSLSINLITKSLYHSIIKDKDDHEGKIPAKALIDIPVFIGKISILTGFIIIEDEDITRDVALSMPFFMKYVSCQKIMKKFAHGDKSEQIIDK